MTGLAIRAIRGGLVAAAAVLAIATATVETSDPAALTVHEWGTFTSIAGEDGRAVQWLPLGGPSDLPCFVERIPFGAKLALPGTVRMETPVLYFYAPQDTLVDVSVRFQGGLVTEWYPRAEVTPALVNTSLARSPDLDGRAVWKRVAVSPRSVEDYPVEPGASHYYAARQTSASPLMVGAQREKFLFYRGVGRFAPPVAAVVRPDGSIDATAPAGDPIGTLVLFENRGGRIGYRVARTAETRMSIPEAVPGGGDLASLRRHLQQLLVAEGLYHKEAAAMIETWQDSWFEEGARLFYVAPRRAVDAVLPLEIRPVPSEIVRVFVGRMELVTARTIRDVKEAILAGDRAAYGKYGRFLEPIGARIAAATPPAGRAQFQLRLRAAYQAYYASQPPTAACR